MKHSLLLGLFLIISFSSFGQKSLQTLSSMPKDEQGRLPFWRCATVEVNEVIRSGNPDLPSEEEFEKFIRKANVRRKQFGIQPLEEQVYTIPVVVHIIHNGEAIGQGSNISYAQIVSQIEVLNEDFRKKEGSRGYSDHPVAADSKIEFVLAEVGPNGEKLAEPGVHRVRNTAVGVSGPLGPYQMDGVVKPATIWNPTQYLNMWTAELEGGLLGYAQFPIASGLDGLDLPGLETAAETDGVVMRYNAFGSSDKGNNFNLMAPYDKGRTTTHELGHFFGLRHIWGDGGCGVDDFCADTPESDAPNYDCNALYYSCGSEDMTQNYMDYSSDPCMSMFTQDQKERFLTVLEYSPRRKELLNSNVLAGARFAANKTAVYREQKVQFTDQSAGSVDSWEWTFEGGEPATSILQNPEIAYSATGAFNVKLKVKVGDDFYEEEKIDYINVQEPASKPVVDFSVNQGDILTGQSIQFQDASDASVYEWSWVIEGAEPATSTLRNPVVSYANVGNYSVSLTATNAKGRTTHTKNSFIQVGLGPMLSSSPAEFGEQLWVDESVGRTLTLTNPGDRELTYSLSSSFDAGVITIEAGKQSGAIAAGASRSINLIIGTGPLYGGNYTGNIEVQTNDPRQELVQLPVKLEITGAPLAEIPQTELDFGITRKREKVKRILTISNPGTDTLVLIPHLENTHFSIEDAPMRVVAKTTYELEVTFDPLEEGVHATSLLLETNDPEKPSFSVNLFGTAGPAPEVVISTSALNLQLTAGDSTNELLSIRNAGRADLTYSIQLKRAQQSKAASRGDSAATSTQSDPTVVRELVTGSGIEDSKVLVIQDTDAWGLDIVNDILTPMGISAHRISSSAIETTDFHEYELIITAGDEFEDYYNAVSGSVQKFEAFVESGGKLIYQAATHSDHVTLAGGVISEFGYMEYDNQIVDLDHPMVQGLSATLSGNYASHNIITNLPAHAQIIIKASGNGQPTTVEYSLGAGTVIATGMTWEHGHVFGHEYGALASTSVEYLLSNSLPWLSTLTKNGTLEPEAQQEVSFKVNAKHLLGGTYYADIQFHTNDPVNEVVSVPVSLQVSGIPEISLSHTELDLGSVWVGETKYKSITIHNPGTDSLKITPVLEEGPFVGDLTPFTVSARKDHTLELGFAAAEAGTFTTSLLLETNDPDRPEVEVLLLAKGVLPPEILTEPAEIRVQLKEGDFINEKLSIKNTGGDTLFYSIHTEVVEGQLVEMDEKKNQAVPKKGERDLRTGKAVTYRSGNDGPNGFGYSWADSKSAEGPAFDWIDINNLGTTLYLGDDHYESVSMPFSFPFYGENREIVYVSSNGFLSFQYDNAHSLQNTNLPDPYTPNELIAAYWTDLYPNSNVKYFGNQDYFIVQFTDVPTFSGSGYLTFQYILYPNGDVKLQYLSTTDPNHAATIGIENATGTEGMEIAFNTPYVENQLAVYISAGGGIGPQPISGKLAPGEATEVDIPFDARNLAVGEYTRALKVNSNDPGQPLVTIPLYLRVVNALPEVIGQVEEVNMQLNREDLNIHLAPLFRDPNPADHLTYFARAENDKVELLGSGQWLNIKALRSGECRVTLFAVDQHGGQSEELSFLVVIADPGNSAPELIARADIHYLQKGQTGNVLLLPLFSDPDGHPLRFEAASSNEQFLKTEITHENTLILIAREAGVASVTVQAKDGWGGITPYSFDVKVNQNPYLRLVIPSQTLLVKSDTLHLNLSDVFSDSEGDLLHYSFETDEEAMLESQLIGNSLRIVAMEAGEATLTLQALDEQEGFVQTTFKILAHYPPQLKESLSSVTLQTAETYSLNLFPYFTEADGEALKYSIEYNRYMLKAEMQGTVLELKGERAGDSKVKIIVTDSRGAELITELQVQVVDVLALEGAISAGMKAYPNPFNKLLTLEIENEEQGTVILVLQDPAGRELKKMEMEKTGSILKEQLSFPELPGGTYFLTIISNEGRDVLKVLKQ